MKNYDFRIRRLEEALNPKGKTVTVVTINYTISESESFVIINGKKDFIPDRVNVKNFIEEKVDFYSGVVVCSMYLTKNLYQEWKRA